jgi:hypothetical protein
MCLVSEKNLSGEIGERLKEQGISLDGIRRCVGGILPSWRENTPGAMSCNPQIDL